MKKNIKKKLNFNKSTIVYLDYNAMREILGGYVNGDVITGTGSNTDGGVTAPR